MTSWDFALDPFGRQFVARAEAAPSPHRDQANEHYLLRVLDAPITIHRAFVELAGSLNAAAILSDLAARGDLSELAGDWVYLDPARLAYTSWAVLQRAAHCQKVAGAKGIP